MCFFAPALTELCSGSTATIIRLPYTWTIKEYKGEFLYRTTDFAIWTTVEVGVGITAGCIATLKPLLKSALSIIGIQSTTPLSSGMPWSRKRGASGGASRGYVHGLDELRPAQGKAVTTTTVTGRRTSSESDEEGLTDSGIGKSDSWKGGIRKDFTTTITEERSLSRAATRSATTDRTTTQEGIVDHSRTLSASGSGNSSCTVGDGLCLDEESKKVAKIYERF